MERSNFNDWLIWMMTPKRNCVHDEVSDMLLTYWFHYINIVFGFPNTWAQGRIRLELKVINVSIKYAKYQWVDRIKIKVIHCKINLIKSFYESILIFFNLFFSIMKFYYYIGWFWAFIAHPNFILLHWFFLNLTESRVVDFSEKIWPLLIQNSLRTDFLK